MAGLGFKDFAVGEVLTAADVDGYLMQQSVMRFADSAARGSALGTATGTAVPLAEGMVAYLDDTDTVEFYDGTAWASIRAAGMGSNVVQTVKTDTFSTTSTSFTALTGVSVSITPTSATSKILLVGQINMNFSTADAGSFRLLRGVTPIAVGDAAGSRTQGTGGTGPLVSLAFTTVPFVFIDAPASASAQTYSVEVRTGGGTLRINTTGNDSDNSAVTRTITSITAIEVAA